MKLEELIKYSMTLVHYSLVTIDGLFCLSDKSKTFSALSKMNADAGEKIEMVSSKFMMGMVNKNGDVFSTDTHIPAYLKIG